MLRSASELLVSLASGIPSLAHWKLNGPVPKAVVLRVTLSPGHAIWFVGPTRLVSGSTATDATDEVALPHKLVTTTSYRPVSAMVGELIVYALEEAPGMPMPSLRHW